MNAGSQNHKATIALLSFIFAVFFTLTIIFAHLSTSSLDFLSATLSRYALEQYGYILELGFISIGLTQLLLAYLLFKYSNIKQLYPVSLLLFFAGTGAIIVAVFPTLLPPASLIDRLPHIIGAVMQFFFFPLALFRLLKNMDGGILKTYTRLTGLITAVLFLVLLVLFILPSMENFAYFGLIEKVNILAINFWLITIAFAFYRKQPGEILLPGFN